MLSAFILSSTFWLIIFSVSDLGSDLTTYLVIYYRIATADVIILASVLALHVSRCSGICLFIHRSLIAGRNLTSIKLFSLSYKHSNWLMFLSLIGNPNLHITLPLRTLLQYFCVHCGWRWNALTQSMKSVRNDCISLNS